MLCLILSLGFYSQANATDEFINRMGECAVTAQTLTGIPASVTIAQAILESGWGRSSLAQHNNFFGLKGRTGVHAPTQEFNGQYMVNTTATFQVFDTIEEACIQHNANYYNGKYDSALPYRGDAIAFVQHISGTYATDPNYEQKLLSLISKYELEQFDVPFTEWRLSYELVPPLWINLWVLEVWRGLN